MIGDCWAFDAPLNYKFQYTVVTISSGYTKKHALDEKSGPIAPLDT